MRPVVVVPTYNERETIPLLARQLLERPLDLGLLVVDDNSPDGTAEVVAALAHDAPDRIHLLLRPGKAGLGRAYVAGFAEALRIGGYDVVVQMDADGSHAASDVDRLVAATADADLVIGSRYISGGSSKGLTGGRDLLSRGGNIYARALLRTGVHDLTGGFKAWRSDLLAKMVDEPTVSDGYGFQIEMTLRAHRQGARIREIPITFHERMAGESKMSPRIASEAMWRVPWMARQYARRHRR